MALFNGFGAASALVALAEIYSAIESDTIPNGLELHVAWIAIGLSALVGWMTLTGSLVAFAKLKVDSTSLGMEEISNLGHHGSIQSKQLLLVLHSI